MYLESNRTCSLRRKSSSRFLRPGKISGKLIGAIVLACVLVGLAFAIYRIRSNALPDMARSNFETARELWDDANISSYEITVKVEGMQPGEYDVVVENDIATAASFDGRALTRQRTFSTWAVTGMFDTLSRDLETHDRDNNLMLKAIFDPELGYPAKYARIELKTGSHDALQWEVTRFVKK